MYYYTNADCCLAECYKSAAGQKYVSALASQNILEPRHSEDLSGFFSPSHSEKAELGPQSKLCQSS